jgi:2-polyprenyl-3-methyl-5-hydroxy-6-metoxy-1,4-benzoquinol methylase
MDKNTSELLEKIRQQFDTAPYFRTPLEQFPQADVPWLYIHSLVTPYYLRNKKVIETEGKVILEAGCGTGHKSLALAQANPGAKIIGIDLSEASVSIATQRLQYHKANAEFYVISIEELQHLSQKFDYINCDEVLYLLPDPTSCLKTMKSVLKQDGIIRVNLHSYLQRIHYLRSQKLFKMMGFMEQNPGELEIELVQEVMNSLKDKVWLKKKTWIPLIEGHRHNILINYLLQGDKGYTIPEMFSVLKTAELEFISMVDWWQWDLMDLFNEPDNLPRFLERRLPETSVEERLYLFELLHPIHRLLDFWCGHPNQAQAFVAVADLTVSAWQQAKVHLHPQLRTAAIKEELTRCIRQLQPFELSQALPIAGEMATLDSTIAACLFPLWENAQLMSSLVERWRKLRPVNPVSLKPTTQEEAFEVVKQALMKLEEIGYVLLER